MTLELNVKACRCGEVLVKVGSDHAVCKCGSVEFFHCKNETIKKRRDMYVYEDCKKWLKSEPAIEAYIRLKNTMKGMQRRPYYLIELIDVVGQVKPYVESSHNRIALIEKLCKDKHISCVRCNNSNTDIYEINFSTL